MIGRRAASTPPDAAKLIEALRHLPSSGAAGFEGLVARLLSAFTGRTFRLAASGTQEGKDLSTDPRGDLVVAVECKRFGAQRPFNTTELKGKMDDAVERDGRLDLWVLAASRQVPAQVHGQLLGHGERLGISVAFLDHDPHSLGPLPALCALHPEITLEALPAAASGQIAGLLEEIRRAPAFQAVIDELRRNFSPADLGYAVARTALWERLTAALSDPETSQEELGQKLLPLAPGARDLPRAALDTALDGWWGSWPTGGRSLVLHGEEGTGKSWGLASWLVRRILPEASAPLLLWCGSGDFEFSSLLELGARLLEQRLPPGANPAQLARRLTRWSAAAGPGASPRVLFVVDGLNERPQADEWRHWLVAARRELAERLPGAALIVTCRTSTWTGLRMETREDADSPARLATEPTAPPRAEPRRKVAEISVADFTDEELERMIELCGLGRFSLDPALRTLLRRPRYFQLAARHWERYATSGDFTVARLFFEEWRDRIETRDRRALTDDEFQRLLRDVAQTFRDSALGRDDLARLLAGNPDVARALEELISAGVFVPVPGASGSLRLESNRLHLGLGLLLVKRLSEAAGTLEQALEAAAIEIEAGGGADDASRIVASAACIALTASGPAAPPRNAVLALLLTLARLPNAADAWEKAQPWMYYPVSPSVFRELAEAEWSQSHPDRRARERIGFAFAWIAEKWPADAALAAMCRRWLSFVNAPPKGESDHGQPPPVTQPELAARIAAVQPFTEERGITPLPIGAPRLLDLADLALSCICEAFIDGGPSGPYLPALAAWAVSNAVLNRLRYAQAARWAVRFGGEALWPQLTDLATQLAAQGEPLLRIAAASLLRLEGSAAAWARAEQLEPLPAPTPAMLPALSEDPADTAPALRRHEPTAAADWLSERALDPGLALERLVWRHQDLLGSIEVADVATGRERTASDLTLEAADAALSRTAPHAYARLARRIVDFVLEQLASRVDLRTEVLEEHFLLLSRRQLARARALLPNLERQQAATPNAGREADWDLTGVALAGLKAARSQVRFLLERQAPEDSADWEDLLAPLPPAEILTMLRRLPHSSGAERRRLLWFPWNDRPALSDRDREVLEAAARDPETATIAGMVPQHAQDPALLVAAIREGQIDDEWLSRILAQQPWARAAVAAASAEIRNGLGPEATSWVLHERALDPEEVRRWTRELDHALRHPPARQTLTSGGRVAVETVSAAMAVVPEVTDAWIAALTGETELSRRLVDVHFSLASALLLALLNAGDERGVAAFSRLLRPQASIVTFIDQPSGVPSHWLLPFKGHDTAAARRAARLLFDQAFTDDDLQRLAFAASLFGRFDAFIDQLEAAPAPDPTLVEARLVALLALAPPSARADRTIERFARNTGGWRPDVAAWARTQLLQDSWARHWFRRFLADPSAVQAWAGFRLFLHGVDRRWVLWHREELERARANAHYETRRRHFALNKGQVGRRIKEQAERQAKTLCGHSVPPDLVPWKRAWRL